MTSSIIGTAESLVQAMEDYLPARTQVLRLVDWGRDVSGLSAANVDVASSQILREEKFAKLHTVDVRLMTTLRCESSIYMMEINWQGLMNMFILNDYCWQFE